MHGAVIWCRNFDIICGSEQWTIMTAVYIKRVAGTLNELEEEGERGRERRATKARRHEYSNTLHSTGATRTSRTTNLPNFLHFQRDVLSYRTENDDIRAVTIITSFILS